MITVNFHLQVSLLGPYAIVRSLPQHSRRSINLTVTYCSVLLISKANKHDDDTSRVGGGVVGGKRDFETGTGTEARR